MDYCLNNWNGNRVSKLPISVQIYRMMEKTVWVALNASALSWSNMTNSAIMLNSKLMGITGDKRDGNTVQIQKFEHFKEGVPNFV